MEEAKKHLLGANAKLASIIERHPRCPMGRPQGERTWPFLFKTIIYQQLSGRSAATIYGRVTDFFGGSVPAAEVLLDIDAGQLRSLGVGGMKATFLKSVAERELACELPSYESLLTRPEQEIRENLTAIKGVGNWTVDMLLMFNLGRRDVFPAGDLGVQKGYALLTGQKSLPSAQELLRAVAPWSPWRSFGAWYLWRLVDTS